MTGMTATGAPIVRHRRSSHRHVMVSSGRAPIALYGERRETDYAPVDEAKAARAARRAAKTTAGKPESAANLAAHRAKPGREPIPPPVPIYGPDVARHAHAFRTAYLGERHLGAAPGVAYSRAANTAQRLTPLPAAESLAVRTQAARVAEADLT